MEEGTGKEGTEGDKKIVHVYPLVKVRPDQLSINWANLCNRIQFVGGSLTLFSNYRSRDSRWIDTKRRIAC